MARPKSLAEGFGLTVAEAMWKGRPVIGGRVGGIQDQIVDGLSGVLVDPTDLEAVAAAIRSIGADPSLGAALGARAHELVAEHFLGPGRLVEYAERLAERVGLACANSRRLGESHPALSPRHAPNSHAPRECLS